MTTYKTGANGIELIKHFESLHDGDLSMVGLQPKMCPAGIWTEGYGHAMLYNGAFLTGPGNKELAYARHAVNDEADAARLLATDLASIETKVNGLNLPINQNQFDAITSLSFNIGFGAFKTSTILERIMGRAPGAANAFSMWNKATVNGKKIILPGLTLRRAAESKLFLS